MGGGAGLAVPLLEGWRGRSPRGRRSPNRETANVLGKGSISAWAEEPTSTRSPALISRVDLRVGGGAFVQQRKSRRAAGRSPRGRRSPIARAEAAAAEGSISAWAEEPKGLRCSACRQRVDLRVGGGASRGGGSHRPIRGRSPRGRRSLIAAHCPFGTLGSISAWAEEPPRRDRHCCL